MDTATKILRMRKKGASYKAIAKKCKISEAWVSKVLTKKSMGTGKRRGSGVLSEVRALPRPAHWQAVISDLRRRAGELNDLATTLENERAETNGA